MNENVKVKSLKKALDILNCFSTQKPELGITEISEQLNLYKSNVHNIIQTFEQCGYVEKNPENNKYHLGMKILELSYIINSNLGIHKIFYPYMSSLSNELNEVLYFAVPQGNRILYLEGTYPTASYSARSMVGETAEMYCTSLGKAILAFLHPDQQEKVIYSQSMKAFTRNTIVDFNKLQEELSLVKKRGYSLDNMEHELGIRCIGVPVYRRDGSLIGAISISGPSPRITDDVIETYADKLKICSEEISKWL